MSILNKKGFTFIEILIVISILTVIASASIPIYGNWQISSQIEEANVKIKEIMRQARDYSMNRFHGAGYGVYILVDGENRTNLVLYQGDSYATRNTDFDVATVLARSLDYSTNLTGDEINFSKGTGIPNNPGVFNIFYQGTIKRIIEINSLGMIESRIN